jgi:hypothetical protein
MTRFRISLIILLLLVGLSTSSIFAVRHAGNTILDAISELEAAETPTSEQCKTVEQAWEKAEPWLLLTVRRDKLMDTATSVYRLRPLLESDCEEFAAELCSLQGNIEFLMQEDGLSLRMLF